MKEAEKVITLINRIALNTILKAVQNITCILINTNSSDKFTKTLLTAIAIETLVTNKHSKAVCALLWLAVMT